MRSLRKPVVRSAVLVILILLTSLLMVYFPRIPVASAASCSEKGTLTTVAKGALATVSDSPTGTSRNASVLPVLRPYGNIDMSIESNPPRTMASDKSGLIYALFKGPTGFCLSVSRDFITWNIINAKVLPAGYMIAHGMDLAITNNGTIIISASRETHNKGNTVFVASFDHGHSFKTVLNVTLTMKPETGSKSSPNPGAGFWHGVAETGKGVILAGLYNPQGLIFRSTNEGRTWSLVFNASAHSDWHNEIHDVEVDPANNFVYASTDDEAGSARNQSIWVSTDQGTHWSIVYSSLHGSSGLPPSVVPLAIGFLDGGHVLALGPDSYNVANGRGIILARIEPSGALSAMTVVQTTTAFSDEYHVWALSSLDQNHLFVLGYSSSLTHVSGVPMFVLTSDGGVLPLFLLDGPNNADLGFLSMSGPDASGRYGALLSVGEGGRQAYFLIVFDYPTTVP